MQLQQKIHDSFLPGFFAKSQSYPRIYET